MEKNKKSFHYFIATFFGLGKFPHAPGTLGSIAAFPIYFIFLFSIMTYKGVSVAPFSFEIANLILFLTFILFIIGVWSAANYSSELKIHDHSSIIIDEIVGQILTINGIMAFLVTIDEKAINILIKLGVDYSSMIAIALFMSLILFRVFDILKPWPISYFDKEIKGGFGIMADDLVAAIMAIFSFYLLIFLVTDIIYLFLN